MFKLVITLVVFCCFASLAVAVPVYGAPRAKYSMMDHQAQTLYEKFGDNKIQDLIRFCQYLPSKNNYSNDIAEDCERLLKVVGYDGYIGY